MCAIIHLFLFVSVSLVFTYCFNIIHSTQLQPSFDFLLPIVQQMVDDSGTYLNKVETWIQFYQCNEVYTARKESKYGILPLRILPYLEWIREIRTRRNSVFRHLGAVLRLKKEINKRICFFNYLITCMISSSKHLRSVFQLEAVTRSCSVQKVLWKKSLNFHWLTLLTIFENRSITDILQGPKYASGY